MHARRLHAAGLLTDDELAEVEEILAGLDLAAIAEEDEDVHSAIERSLGEVGRKIHAGRSRNDQVAAAMRLYVQDACAEALEAIGAFALAVLDVAEAEADTVMPGYTHLQRAQPVTLGWHLLAWVEMLDRDRTRFELRGRAGARVAARRGRARGLDAAAAAAAGDAKHARRGRRPRLRARLPLRRAPCSSSTSPGSARSWCSGRRRSSASSRLPDEAATGLVDDAAEAEPGRRRARARQGGHRDRPADRACSRR